MIRKSELTKEYYKTEELVKMVGKLEKGLSD